MQSKTLIDSGHLRSGIQMGPDWKIYGTVLFKDSLNVINNPSVYGSGCNFQRNAVALGGPCTDGLPQYIQRYKAYFHASGICQNNSLHFISDIWPPPDSVHWDFGDPGSGLNNYSNLFNPTHTYANIGTYTVELFVRHIDNRTDTTWQTITIVASPAVALGPDKSICVGDSATFDAGACNGCIYLWKDLGTGLPVGTSQTFRTGLAGNYSVTVTRSGCSGSDTVQLITTPVPIITNNQLTKSICSGESTNIPLTSNVAGTNFHWTATLTSGTVTGFTADSGLLINQILTNPISTPGVVTYHVTPKIGNCRGDTVDFLVIVNAGDSVKVSITASGNNVCAGTSVTFTATPTNPGTTPAYQWKVNGINSGTNSTSFIYTPLNNDVVTCVLTSSNTVCTSNNPATSNAITMIVNPALPVSVSISASANPVCSGASVTFTAIPVNGGSTPAYQWKVNGLPVGTNNPVYSYVPLTGDVVTCILTSNALCATGSPAISSPVTMTVNPNLPVSISISATSNPFCQGSSVIFTAVPTNGGTTPAYQWKVNGINAGTNSSSYSYIPNNGDVVSCVLNSNIACPIGNPANSNAITMIQNNTVPVSVSIAASSNPVCAGTSVTFTATPINGGAAPVYQWKRNGSNVGTNSTTYTYIPINGDVITCTLTSNAACASGNPATSNSVTMTVNPNLPVSISISASANPVCAGTTVIFTATPVNGGISPSYQWFVNSVPVGTNNPVYSYIPNNGDLVSCTVTSSAICATNNPASSIQYPVSVNPNMPVSVAITASANPICSGIAVTFTASPTNGGSTPVYQWKVNGANAGTNSSTYTYNPAAGDQVQCILTSNIVCPTGNPAASNMITMNVASPPVVTFTSCFDTITTLIAKPIKLRGGIPFGGTYSGTGVNSLTGIFTPSLAGTGMHTITYTCTNASLCTAAKSRTIAVLSTPAFTCGNNLTDIRDGKSYPTVQIGTQCWFAEDLNYGTAIPDIQDQRDNCISEKYHNPASSIQHPASAYQWDEVMQYDETPAGQGFCPPGWHIPTENDWNALFSVYINNGFAGNPLKYSGYSGFNALLSGARHINQGWNFQGFAVFFWSSTPRGNTKAWAHGMNDIDPSVSFYPSSRVNAFSVRCLKD
ncbi:MAG: PKD domain-containing protein [Bacteroidetes bacterium]|nr:PKD domain-containing protein [Bacteroidota bacterium]